MLDWKNVLYLSLQCLHLIRWTALSKSSNCLASLHLLILSLRSSIINSSTKFIFLFAHCPPYDTSLYCSAICGDPFRNDAVSKHIAKINRWSTKVGRSIQPFRDKVSYLVAIPWKHCVLSTMCICIILLSSSPMLQVHTHSLLHTPKMMELVVSKELSDEERLSYNSGHGRL